MRGLSCVLLWVLFSYDVALLEMRHWGEKCGMGSEVLFLSCCGIEGRLDDGILVNNAVHSTAHSGWARLTRCNNSSRTASYIPVIYIIHHLRLHFQEWKNVVFCCGCIPSNSTVFTALESTWFVLMTLLVVPHARCPACPGSRRCLWRVGCGGWSRDRYRSSVQAEKPNHRSGRISNCRSVAGPQSEVLMPGNEMRSQAIQQHTWIPQFEECSEVDGCF
jgi:hypothetical protein